MPRPRDWYEMSYEEQEVWNRNERQHEQQLWDAQDSARRATEELQGQLSRQRHAAREAQDNAAGDLENCRGEIARLREFLAVQGLEEEYNKWRQLQGE
jgi:hypothetical protein